MLDLDQGDSLFLLATNLMDLIDRALFRRLDHVLSFPLPTDKEVDALLVRHLPEFAHGQTDGVAFRRGVGDAAKGLSHAEVVRVFRDIRRHAVIDSKNLASFPVSDLLYAAAKNKGSMMEKSTEGRRPLRRSRARMPSDCLGPGFEPPSFSERKD